VGANKPLFSCIDVTLGYEGKTVAANISFTVNAGDYLCIVGENGSGKSTLMKAMLRLVSPLSGKVAAGEGVSPGKLGFLPQQTVAHKDFPASVREVVRSGCLNRCGLRPFYNKREKLLAEENMRMMGVAHIAKRCYRELSGGQQQRALLARALCAAQNVLLLDEPVAGLDPIAAAEMYEILKKLNEAGTTIVMISHDIAASVRYASHILHMGGQSALFFGETKNYAESEIGRAYAGTEGVCHD
jgi:zinc transport system ATP-binding protein